MSAVGARHTLLDGLSVLHERYAISLTEGADLALMQLVELLLKWNKVYNLTANGDAVQIVQRHLLDSLVMCRWLPPETSEAESPAAIKHNRVIDVGSGAGFPVLPLAIARPDLKFVSIESNGKKTRFQQQVVMELKLQNVDIHNERVQQVHVQGDFVTSRAFTAPEQFLTLARSLCGTASRVGIMLGQAERMPAVLPTPFVLEELEPVHIPGTQGQRHVAICRCT